MDMSGMMKPVAIVVTLIIAVIAVTILNSSDLLSGGTCITSATGAVTTDTLRACEITATTHWEYSLDVFPGFRQLALILPLIIVAVILYGAWKGTQVRM